MTTQGTQVTLTIPDGAPPGTLLSVPVRGGAETLKVRVPDGMGPGSTLILTQPEGTDEWNMKVGQVQPLAEDFEEPPAATELAPAFRQPVEPGPSAGLDSAVAYTVRLETTAGVIDIICRPDWAPHGCRRFLELAASGDLQNLTFYRAIKGCIVQFGLPAKRLWPPIPDDPPTSVPFLLGAVSFAAIGENTRKSTLFICIGDMSHMLGQKTWETPIGAVAETSLDILENIETAYGDIAEFGGAGPDTNRINNEGDAYLNTYFPRLTYIDQAYPLDWAQDEPQPGSFAPAPATGAHASEHQVAMALQAAQEAQLQAEQASQAATRAALAEHAAQAAEAAQTAQLAAQVAKAAADAARAARRAQEEALYSPMPSQQVEPIDVPVELKPPQRFSVARQPLALGEAPRGASIGHVSYRPPMSAPLVVAPAVGQSVVMSAGLQNAASPLPPSVMVGGNSMSFRSKPGMVGSALIPGTRQPVSHMQGALHGHSPLLINR